MAAIWQMAGRSLLKNSCLGSVRTIESRPMSELRSWILVARFFLQFFLFRLKLAPRPCADNMQWDALKVIGRVLGWGKRLHVRGGEHCPTDHPSIFCGNHIKLDDPFAVSLAVYQSSVGAFCLRVMGRDDFFEGTRLNNPFFSFNELVECLGAVLITRENVTLSQLKPFLGFLEQGMGIVMFPGRTRTRSGLFVEYRGDFQEPGGVSFFIHHTQRRNEGLTVGAVPVVRTFNPVNKHSTMIFGPAQYLVRDADKEAQRDFDCRLVEVMAGLVEVNVAHVLSALLYLRCLHALTGPLPMDGLQNAVKEVLTETGHPYIHPENMEELPTMVRKTLAYLEKRSMLTRKGRTVVPNAGAILNVPELNGSYRKQNAVKYLTNQILHLSGVTSLVEKKARAL